MTSILDLKQFLDSEYPLVLAEEWDNVGLLVGRLDAPVQRILTCLTVTSEVCDEAIREKIDLIVSHHPFPFHAVKRITSETIDGRLLMQLISGGVAVYSPHTAHDSAPDGVNRQLATLFELVDVEPLNENGSGRIGNLVCSTEFERILYDTKRRFGNCVYIGSLKQRIKRIAVGCGAADEFIEQAHRLGADLFVLGEARFHTCLQAQSLGIALVLLGHYASERFAVETLAEKIAVRFPEIHCFPSQKERDPTQVYDGPG